VLGYFLQPRKEEDYEGKRKPPSNYPVSIGSGGGKDPAWNTLLSPQYF
jgi:hypothetical protein